MPRSPGCNAPVFDAWKARRSTAYHGSRKLVDEGGAIDGGALDVKVPKHARKELEAYLDCGLLCRGFARLRCGSCNESRLVAFSCKGRGFCPSCLGRRMCATGLQPDPGCLARGRAAP